MSARLRARFRTSPVAIASSETAVSDGELVSRFADTRDEDCFAELVRRHGPMVLATCRRVLHPDVHTADDAFQAAFLVLATKAATVSPPERIGAWLHGVAVHVAKKAKAWARKLAPSAPADLDRIPAVPSPTAPDAFEVRAKIDDVLASLPAKYRAAVVLCDLEGRSRSEAAALLGWREGTLSGRLARARKLLADRLARRGVVLPAAGLGVLLPAPAATASVPVQLAASTVRIATMVAAGATGEAVPAPVTALAQGVVAVHSAHFKLVVAGCVALVLALGGFGAVKLFDRETVAAAPQPPEPGPVPKLVPKPRADEKPAPKPSEWKLAHTWRFPGKLTTVAVGADFVVGGDRLGTLAVFDLKTGKERRKLREGTDGGGPPGVERVQLSSDGKLLRLVLESTGFHEMRVEPKLNDTQYPSGVAEYPRGTPFGVTTDGRAWLLYSKATDELRVVPNQLATKPFEDKTEIVFKHNTVVDYAAGASVDAIATITGDRGWPVLRFWNASKDKNKPVWEVDLWKEVANIDVTGVAVSPDGKRVAVVGDAGAVWVFDAKTGKRTAKADALTGPVDEVTFSPDGKRIAVACSRSIARVIDAETGKELAVLKGHEKDKSVTCVAFGPDSNTIATGSTDQTVRVWELKK